MCRNSWRRSTGGNIEALVLCRTRETAFTCGTEHEMHGSVEAQAVAVEVLGGCEVVGRACDADVSSR